MTTIKSYKVPGLKKEIFGLVYIEREIQRREQMGLPTTGYYGCQWQDIICGGRTGYKTSEEAENHLKTTVIHLAQREIEELQRGISWSLEDFDLNGKEFMFSKLRGMKNDQERLATLERSSEKLKSDGLSSFVAV